MGLFLVGLYWVPVVHKITLRRPITAFNNDEGPGVGANSQGLVPGGDGGGAGGEEDTDLRVGGRQLRQRSQPLLERSSTLSSARAVRASFFIDFPSADSVLVGADKYERDARKYWDKFYKRHQDKVRRRFSCSQLVPALVNMWLL